MMTILRRFPLTRLGLNRVGIPQHKDFCHAQPPTPAEELLAEFWQLEKETEAFLKGLAQ